MCVCVNLRVCRSVAVGVCRRAPPHGSNKEFTGRHPAAVVRPDEGARLLVASRSPHRTTHRTTHRAYCAASCPPPPYGVRRSQPRARLSRGVRRSVDRALSSSAEPPPKNPEILRHGGRRDAAGARPGIFCAARRARRRAHGPRARARCSCILTWSARRPSLPSLPCVSQGNPKRVPRRSKQAQRGPKRPQGIWQQNQAN